YLLDDDIDEAVVVKIPERLDLPINTSETRCGDAKLGRPGVDISKNVRSASVIGLKNNVGRSVAIYVGHAHCGISGSIGHEVEAIDTPSCHVGIVILTVALSLSYNVSVAVPIDIATSDDVPTRYRHN